MKYDESEKEGEYPNGSMMSEIMMRNILNEALTIIIFDYNNTNKYI
jgi:hypothetical protein